MSYFNLFQTEIKNEGKPLVDAAPAASTMVRTTAESVDLKVVEPKTLKNIYNQNKKFFKAKGPTPGALNKIPFDHSKLQLRSVMSVPAPRLVGIEPNPGPSMKITIGKKHASQAMQMVPKAKGTNQKKKKRRQRQPKQQVSQRMRNAGLGLANSSDRAKLIRVLNNPFDEIPVRLGCECMQPTGIATLSTRIPITLGAANQSFVIYPRANVCLLSSVTASSPYTYTNAGSYPSYAALLNVASGARVIASGVRVMSAASATNDNGLVTIGCLPRDRTLPADITSTVEGFPAIGSTTATQGFTQFLNYLQTESYPLKQGASSFYRPQDPLDFQFRLSPNIDAAVITSHDLQPFFVVGISNATSGQTILFELITHVEYTVSGDSAGIINTGFGTLSTHDVTQASTSVFGNAIDSSISGVVGGLQVLDRAYEAGRQMYQRYSAASGAWLSSTDNANNLMLLD
jgi:hypothetical protein